LISQTQRCFAFHSYLKEIKTPTDEHSEECLAYGISKSANFTSYGIPRTTNLLLFEKNSKKDFLKKTDCISQVAVSYSFQHKRTDLALTMDNFF
jgi:hypothetical protein